MNPTELRIHRRNTAAFIAADPVLLVLTPVSTQRTASGGYVQIDGDPMEAQTFRLIPTTDKTPEIKTSNGRLIKPEFILLGQWDCLMEMGAKFEFLGVAYEIATPPRPQHSSTSIYERKADVVRRQEGA